MTQNYTSTYELNNNGFPRIMANGCKIWAERICDVTVYPFPFEKWHVSKVGVKEMNDFFSRESQVPLFSQLSLCSALFHPENAYEYVRFFSMSTTHFHQLGTIKENSLHFNLEENYVVRLTSSSKHLTILLRKSTANKNKYAYVHLHCQSSYSQNIHSFYH